MTTVGVAIPAMPIRKAMLARALSSVAIQTRMPDRISVVVDHERLGAAVTRNRAWRALGTDYVAFLDDDDELKPVHLQWLTAALEAEEADFVYPWFDVVGGGDPFPESFGKPWDPANPIQTTITGLWRRSALEAIGGFPEEFDPNLRDGKSNRMGEDLLAVQALNEKGGKIVHLPERTWTWHHHGRNTSGCNYRW